MLDATDAMLDAPASQGANSLIPMSLSLVAKKEKILKMEVSKLEKLVTQRNEMLVGLRESHDYLLTTNGRLQERSRLRREKLVSLRTLLETDQEQDGEQKPILCDAIGLNELEATAEKCGVLKDILLGLVDKRAGLEQHCMGLEEQTVQETVALRTKEDRLKEVRNTILLLREEIRSSQWNFENDQAELNDGDKHLNSISQVAQREAIMVEKAGTALQAEKALAEDLQETWQNYEGMVHEEHRQLAIVNEDARSEQRERRKLLESNGATCPADEEVLQTAKALQLRLQHLNEDVASTKFLKREIALRRKQEKDMLAIAQSSIKAKDEQLNWLERQRVHLENEQNEATKARANDEVAYRAFIEDHNAEVASLEAQTKDARKQMKSTERATTAHRKKVAAVNKTVAQKTKVLQEWKTRIEAKQGQVAKSTSTQELVDAEVMSMQEALEQELRGLQQSEKLRTAQEMETEELRSSCAELESEIQQTRKTLATMKNSIAAAQTAVKNRIDEVRDKFLSTFVVDDAEILIELLNKEIESWTTKDKDEVDESITSETSKLKERYGILVANIRKKYDRTLRQKEKQYNAKLEKLKKQTAEKKAKSTTMSTFESQTGEDDVEMPTDQDHISVMVHEHADETMENRAAEKEDNEAKDQDIDPSWMKHPSNENVLNKKRSSKPNLKAKVVPKKATKSARRQLVSGLNLADDSPQTDKELTDIFTADATAIVKTTKTAKPGHATFSQQRRLSGSGARQSRLKRRTPAQKAGKPAAIPVQEGIATVDITPKTARSVSIEGSTHPNPAADTSSQDSLVSSIGCDESLVVTRSAQEAGSINQTKRTPRVSLSTVASQSAAKKPLMQKAGHRSKGAVKRRTTTKVLHRSRHSKASRVSLGRSQPGGRTADWSATDTFSFD